MGPTADAPRDRGDVGGHSRSSCIVDVPDQSVAGLATLVHHRVDPAVDHHRPLLLTARRTGFVFRHIFGLCTSADTAEELEINDCGNAVQ